MPYDYKPDFKDTHNSDGHEMLINKNCSFLKLESPAITDHCSTGKRQNHWDK